ncbi:hypothetical protein C0995_016555 [Termitomyces sp. Mi166|nr:hypothetical protein C0995_016555 [Termitomyces sp. Mi166\
MYPEKLEPAPAHSVQTQNIAKADPSVDYDIDPNAERKLVRKLDVILLSLFGLAYCTNFIDSGTDPHSIYFEGNAKIAGIEKDLGMSGFDYNVSLTYIFVEIPSNLALKRFGSPWLAALITIFGVVTITTAFVKSYAGLIVNRMFLGLAEGGTLAFLLDDEKAVSHRFYSRRPFGIRFSFGSRYWLPEIMEKGIITTGFGLLCFFILPNDPCDTRLLNDKERTLVLACIDASQIVRTQGRREKTTLKLVLQSLSLPDMPFRLGHETLMLGDNSALSLEEMVLTSYRSYAACFLSLSGASPGGPLVLAWATDNASPDTVKAVTPAMVLGIGALGSVIAMWTYLPTDAPDYHNGNSLNLSTSCGICVLVVLSYVYLRHENAKRDRGERDHRLQGKLQSEIEELGYLHPEFRYQT